jgi:hypothetical protein
MLPARFNEFDREAERGRERERGREHTERAGCAFFRFSPEIAGERFCERALRRGRRAGRFGFRGRSREIQRGNGGEGVAEDTMLLKAVSGLHLLTGRGVPRNSARGLPGPASSPALSRSPIFIVGRIISA